MNINLQSIKGFFLLFSAVFTLLNTVEAELWIFEGVIEESAPALHDIAREGFVLSGSIELSIDSLELSENEEGEPILNEGIQAGELTVDRNHILKLSSDLVVDSSFIQLYNNDTEEQGQDRIAISIPTKKASFFEETKGLSLVWLQIWLFDREGEMLRTSDELSSDGLRKWKKGWFRISFINEAEEYLFCEGYLTLLEPFDPSSVDELSDKNLIASLASELNSREDEVQQLKDALGAAEERIRSLNNMVDLLIEERDHLKEQAILENVPHGSNELKSQLDNLTAENVVLKEELSDSRKSFSMLNENVFNLKYDNSKLVKEIELAKKEAEELKLALASLKSEEDEKGMRQIKVIESTQEATNSEETYILLDSESLNQLELNEENKSKNHFDRRRRGPRSRF